MQADAFRFQNDYEKWLAVVGLLTGSPPYKIFIGKIEKSFNLLATVEKIWLIQNHTANSKTRYDFQYVIDNGSYRIIIEESLSFLR
ncbi:MAG: hypothetical protein ABI045_03260 [Flavobacteriales bacterium]